MKITMISNYINHHQIPFCRELYQSPGVDFRFIQTEPMEEERIAMGWGLDAEKLPYVLFLDRDGQECEDWIRDSELLLAGWTRQENLLKERLEGGRITIRISERLYREGQWKVISPRGLLHKYREHTRYRRKNVFLLCAGAYVASDFSLVKAYPGKMFCFGYFPEMREYTQEELCRNHPWPEEANGQVIRLVWAGRFLPLKHPEQVIFLARELKKDGYRFHIDLIGGGPMEEELKEETIRKGLEKEITFHGFLSPEGVREIMEKSHIHLFTSNHLEGWGAVVNEAMNSGCVEVINVEAGAGPFLVKHGGNGLFYRGSDPTDLLRQVRYLLEHPAEGMRMGLAAYETIRREWNAPEAARRLLNFYEQIKEGRIQPPASGPLSRAPVVSPRRMYSFVMKKAKEAGEETGNGTEAADQYYRSGI